MKIMNKIIFPLVAVILSGCISQTTTSQQASTGGAGGLARPSVIAVRPPSGPQIINKTVLSGKTVAVAGSIAANPDCSSRGISTLRVVQAPVHGKITIVQREDFTSFPPNNPRSACNKTKLPGIFADYTSDNGFTGDDFLVLELVSVSGDDKIWKIAVTVK